MNIPIHLDDFLTFLRFKSVSTEPKFRKDLIECSDWVAEYLKVIGFDVEKWDTSGYPVIFASNMKAGPKQPTLLIYNHYDVQPVDPLELWTSDPFEPEVRDGEVYARGAQDNKGQCFYVFQALKALLEKEGKFPINIKLCIEGEEEKGSSGLKEILSKKEKELSADYLAIVDMGIQSIKEPAITLGIRGVLSFDLEVTGSKGDLHSGCHGGLAFNPIHALTQLLASLRDPNNGKILVQGFYEGVTTPSREELSQLDTSFDAAEYERMFGTQATGGEQEFTPIERNWFRPTLEINGINGGYTGEGFKTVIPAKAIAKFSCRLVPNQDPERIANLIVRHIQAHTPKGIKTKVTVHEGGSTAVRTSSSSPVVQAFAKALTETFKVPCKFIMEGASIPVATDLALASGAEVALVGLGLPDDNIHAPNEHFGVQRLELGAAVIARTIHHLKK